MLFVMETTVKKDLKKLISQAADFGFSQSGELNLDALIFMPEVRDMCAADKCRSFGKNWRCPPGCGSIEDAAEKASKYNFGVIVQTIGKLDDDFDYETIAATSKKHNKNFALLIKELKKDFADILPMGAGTCTLCETCTYPDAPCRFPEDSISSMEAYGLWVSKVCELSRIPYNNGKQTITYTSCYLLK